MVGLKSVWPNVVFNKGKGFLRAIRLHGTLQGQLCVLYIYCYTYIYIYVFMYTYNYTQTSRAPGTWTLTGFGLEPSGP